jgi:GT2 family glycosyltransferase
LYLKKSDVILLNSDIIAHENWLESLCYGAYGYTENVGIVGPMLLYPDGRIQSAGSHRNTESTEYFDHYYRFKDKNYGPANIPYKCMGVTGAVMYIKKIYPRKNWRY